MPLESSTNLTDLSGIKVPNEWMRGGNTAFVDSPAIYSGGTNDLVLVCHTTARIYVYTSQDKGVTWTQLTLVASDPIYPLDAPNSVCLTSDGKVHCVSGSFQYSRINLVRTDGHVTGYSWDTATALAIPTSSDSGYYVHFFPVIKRVINGLGNECLFISLTCTAAEDTNTLRIGAFCTTNITPSAATDFKSLAGVASTATLIWSTNRATDGASGYETWADTVQHPTSSINYLFFGQGANETTWTQAPVGYYPITPDSGASTWTVGTQVIVGRGGTSGPGWHLWGTARDTSNIYFAYDPAATGPKIGRIDGSGTLTASFLTIETLSVNAIGTFECTTDGTKFFAVYCTNWNASPRTSKRAFYEDGAWSYIDDDGTFDTNAWLPGQSKVSDCGRLHELCAFLNQDNNQTNAKCDYWISTVIASTAQIGGTLSYTAAGGAISGGSSLNRGHVPGVVWEASGTVAYSALNGSSVSPGFPAMIAGNPFGDGLVAFVHQKPSTANSGTVTTPSGWTLVGSIAGAGGYSTTLGADTGNTNLFVYTKDTVTGSETGTQAFTLGTNNVSSAQIHRVSKYGTGAWQFALATGSRNASANGTVAVQMSTNPGITVGDLLIGYFGIPTDVTTPAQFASESFSAAGITTWGTLAEVNEPDSTIGNDLGGVVIQNRALAGTATAAPYFNATATGTTTNVRGPIVILRAREATNQTSSYTTAGGALSGGAASESRTWLQSVAGGALAGAAASVKRAVVAAVAAGAIAGGSASVATATATGLSYTAIGGAICGGSSAVKQTKVLSATSGALAGGAVVEKRLAVRPATGGSVAAGAATYVRTIKAPGSAGAVAGGSATETRLVKSVVTGGALVGGSATVTINAPSVLAFTAVGGAVSGGSVVEKRASRGIVTGGCVSGGTANEKRTVITTASGGSIAGGAASKSETRRIAATGGALTGGSATEKRVAARTSTGGAISGATVRVLQLRTWAPTGGAIVGGEAPWASSAPKSYYYEGDGGALAGGISRAITLNNATAIGGAVSDGSAVVSRTKTALASGGALVGGSAPELLIGVRRGTGGATAGASARAIAVTSRLPVGGALSGGSASISWIQSGVMTYAARGGAITGGASAVVLAPVAPVVVHIPGEISVSDYEIFSVEIATEDYMRPIYVGDTIPILIETRELNGADTGPLYDPSVLTVTVRFSPSGRTDSITFGGTETSNMYLTRLSVGRYRLLYPAGIEVGTAYIEARVSEDVSGVPYVADMRRPTIVPIRQLKTGHIDAPASV
jgi:hypothetical protein